MLFVSSPCVTIDIASSADVCLQYVLFRHIDKEEYVLSTTQTTENHESAEFEAIEGTIPDETVGVSTGAEKHQV